MKSSTTIIAFLLISANCFSQSISSSVVNAGGGSFKNGYYQFEWSIGEMSLINEMQSGSNNLIVTNGFLQPYILYPATYYSTSNFMLDEVRIFPNPASRYVEINFFTKEKGRITLDFFDALGKKVYSEQIISNGVDLIHRIPVAKFASGTYMLYINLDGDPGYLSKRSAFKILKIE
jgi:hypothetical protein